MTYLIPLVVLFFCAPVVYLPVAKVRMAVGMIMAALFLGAMGSSWPCFMPKNFLIDHPWAVNSPLHPSLSVFWGGICLLFAMGLCVALGVRTFLIYMNLIKPR